RQPRLHRPGHRRTPHAPARSDGGSTRSDDPAPAPGPCRRTGRPDPRGDRTTRDVAASSRPGERRAGSMTRRNRDRDAEREAVRAAATRLLAGAPFRSTAGKLTGTELIAECGLRRDIVYGDHKDLVDEFKARATAQNFTPQVAQRIAED